MAGVIVYEAPSACPAESEARAVVGGYLGEGSDVTLRVEPRGASFAGVIELGDFRRELTGDDCRALVRALVLSASLSRRAAPEAPPAPAVAPPIPEAPKPEPVTRPEVWLGLEAGARTLVGPPVAPVGALAVAFGTERAPQPLVCVAIERTTVSSIERISGRTKTLLTAARVDGCPLQIAAMVAGAPASLAGCAVVEVGALEAGVDGPGARAAETRPWLSAGLAGRPSVALTRSVAIDVILSGFVPLVRDRFVAAAETYRAPSPGGALGVGLRVRFP